VLTVQRIEIKEGETMRRQGLVAALLAITLLGLPGGARAQNADPLGLASVGVVLPFWLGKGEVSMLQVASPVGPNTGVLGPRTHLVFFNAGCSKSELAALPLTENDVDFVSLSSFTTLESGVVVIAGRRFSRTAPVEPLRNPIHARVHWISVAEDFWRVVDPISVSSPSFPGQRWNPLQTAATFFAPLIEPGQTDATLHLVCPTLSITGDLDTPGLIQGAPKVPGATATSNGVATQVPALVFDDEEAFLGDVLIPCTCLTSRTLTSIGSVYSDSVSAPNGTYTELLGGTPGTPKRFTGYLGIRTTLEGVSLDAFARLHNGPKGSIFPNP
jgi:hypothetical protein